MRINIENTQPNDFLLFPIHPSGESEQ